MKISALVVLVAFAGHEPLATVALAAPAQGRARTADGSCRVPSVVGLTRAAAEERLRVAQLSSGRIESTIADQQPGTVIEQQPRECATPPADGRVNLVVAADRGTSDGAAPGKTGGTSVGKVAVPLGIAVGAAVIASIVAGRKQKTETKVPNLISLPIAAIDTVLKKARLTRGELTTIQSMTATAGTVAEQSPAAGALVAAGSPVNVRVSSGRPTTEIPDLVGLPWRSADARTSEARLRLLVTDAPEGDRTSFNVVSQVPAAGTRVAPGAAVGVALRAAQVVAAPPPDATPPLETTPPTATAPQPSSLTQPTTPDPLAGGSPPATTPAAPTATPVAQGASPPPPALSAPRPAPGSPLAPSGTQRPPLTIESLVAIIVAATPWKWIWALLLLALAGVGFLRWHQPSTRDHAAVAPVRPVPPIVPRITVVPRLDRGHQVVAVTGGGHSDFGLVCRIDAGRQHLRVDDDAPAVVQMGAGV